MFEVIDHIASAKCFGCDKKDKECLVLRTESYCGPHCQKCVMREARKRKQPEMKLQSA